VLSHKKFTQNCLVAKYYECFEHSKAIYVYLFDKMKQKSRHE